MLSASNSKASLDANGYTTTIYSDTEAKALITGLNFEGFTLTNALFAEKGTGDDKDLLLAFYFSSVELAESFISRNEYENLGPLNTYGDNNLGSKLTKKVGMHNNVAYVGSETSFNCAFN